MGGLKLIVGILSARASSAVVQQLVDTLAGAATVVLHHDFLQQPGFRVTAPNLDVLEDHAATRWGDWSLVDAMLRLLRRAIVEHRADYFQLVSDTCLPIRPLDEFTEYLRAQAPDTCIGLLPVAASEPASYSHIGRIAREGSATQTLLEYSVRPYLGPGKRRQPRIVAGVRIMEPASHSREHWLQRIGQFATLRALAPLAMALTAPATSRGLGLRPHVGSQWFACSGSLGAQLIQRVDGAPEICEFFRRTKIPDESFFQTLVGTIAPKKIAPPNHFLMWHGKQHGPGNLQLADFAHFRASRKFFARKFANDARDPLRLKVIEELSRSSA
jgi:hypothetical protein